MKTESVLSTKIYQNSGNPPLLDMIPTKTGGRALDCGCGAGDNAGILTSRGWHVTGITISAREQEIAAQRCDKVYLADLEQGLPALEGKYDLVIMSHVLEHLVRPEALLCSVKRILAPDAKVAVALPNALHYRPRLEFLRGNFHYTETGPMDETHLHFYTFSTGEALLVKQGYRVINQYVQGGFPLWRFRGVLPKSMVSRIDSWACKHYPGLFGYQSLYYAEMDR